MKRYCKCILNNCCLDTTSWHKVGKIQNLTTLSVRRKFNVPNANIYSKNLFAKWETGSVFEKYGFCLEQDVQCLI